MIDILLQSLIANEAMLGRLYYLKKKTCLLIFNIIGILSTIIEIDSIINEESDYKDIVDILGFLQVNGSLFRVAALLYL